MLIEDLLCAGHCVGFVCIGLVPLPVAAGRGNIMLPILQVDTLRLRKVKSSDQVTVG